MVSVNSTKKISRQRTLSVLNGMMLSACLTFSAASADDTEVFFAQVATDASSSANSPNILLLLDDSLSMYAYDSGQTGTRMERMQQALHNMLDGLSNVNVGIMTMNGSKGGGPVRYPVTPIDKPVCAEEDCDGILLYSSITDPVDDTEQSLTDGVMRPGGNNLSVGGNERPSGDPQSTGLRFRDIGVPQGATIVSAVVEMTAQYTNSGPDTLTVSAEKTESATEFTNEYWNLSDRPQTTSVSFDPGAWVAGERYETADLSPVIQELVDQDNWCGGGNIALNFTGTDSRVFVSYESSVSHAAAGNDRPAAQLRVVYDPSTIPAGQGCTLDTQIAQVTGRNNDGYQNMSTNVVNRSSTTISIPQLNTGVETMSAMRFAEVTVPQGAQIVDARVEFTVDTGRTDDFSAIVSAELTDTAPTLRGGRKYISNRAQTAAKVTWNHTEDTVAGGKMTSTNIAPVVQEIVDRAGWQPLNELMVFVRRNGAATGQLQSVKTFNASAGVAPKLYVTYKTYVGDSDFSSLHERTARHEIADIVDQLRANYFTPTLSLQYEAAQYMLGGPVTYGRKRGGDFINSNFRVSHPDSYTGGTLHTPIGCTQFNPFSHECEKEEIMLTNSTPMYISPIQDSCQSNHIVLLSDGATSNDNADDLIRPLIGATECDENNSGSQACGTDLVRWLYENDLDPSIPGDQNVLTHTVAFNLSGNGANYLQAVAAAGGGEFHTAASASDLSNAFNSIINGVQAVDTSFTAPGATVNQFNRLSHRDDVYFALFQPNETPKWTGNVKRYKLGVDTTNGSGNEEADILDANDDLAIDTVSGFFKDASRSFWDHIGDEGNSSVENDGPNVAIGGAASRIGANGIDNRKLYTYLGDNNAIPANGVDLNSGAHNLHENNAGITSAMLNIDSGGTAAEQQENRSDLLKWVRGVDMKDQDEDGILEESRRQMGDPMHSQPVILNYRTGTTTNNDTSVVYVTTNEGLLHAIDAATGNELWAFSPKELMGLHNVIFDDYQSNSHPYGLDGPLELWRDETNDNFVIESGESAYLYLSMRRGGHNYYALDITDPNDPKLKWVINGSETGPAEFREIGQTWSRAKHATIYDGGTERDVLIFGAGYDVNQDADAQRDVNGNTTVMEHTTDAIGRGIYIVDARTGEHVWSVAGPDLGNGTIANQRFADMQYSIPGDIRTVDIDYDGYVDQLYAADTGGQVWRFDFSGSTADNLLQGGVIAKLSDTDDANHRRFYGEPDVALIQDEGLTYLSISIGSGWRAHPLNDVVQDAQYVLRVPHVRTIPDGYGIKVSENNYRPITEADLHQVNASSASGSDADDLTYGWYLRFADAGEKVMGTSLIFKNVLYFTTYVPAPDTLHCTTALGSGYAYALSITNGSAVYDLDDDGTIETNGIGEAYEDEDIRYELSHKGPPPNATVLVAKDTNPEVFIGTEKIPTDINSGTTRTYWVDTGAID